MIYSLDKLEHEFSNLLQSNIAITLDDKVLREGKLILFSIKNFYLTFSLSSPISPKRLTYYELPSPFFYEANSKGIQLSYKLKYFHQDDSDILVPMQLLSKIKPHKIYNRDVSITIKN